MAQRSPQSFRLIFSILLIGLTLLVAGCGPQAWTSADGWVAEQILGLHTVLFWLSVIVFVGVEALIIWVIFRYRHRPGEELRVPPQTHGNTRLEIFWSIIPVIIVVIIAIPTVQLIGQFTRIPSTGETINVRAIGYQWWWSFEYPELGFTTADELHIPVGQPIAFDLESADVIHSFWVPKLAGALDMIPGRVNRMWFVADEPGYFYGHCKEFCGASHALMRFRVIAESPEDFQAWVASMKRPAEEPADPLAQYGAYIFGVRENPPSGYEPVEQAGVCASCHTIRGTTANAKAGPDLTQFGDRTTIAAGILENTPENLADWLRDPPAIKPGVKMPDYGLDEQSIEALVAYLEGLGSESPGS